MRHGARWLRSLLAAAVVVSGAAISGVAHAETVTRTIFSDDFSGGRGSGPDPAKWSGNAWDTWQDGDGHLVLDSSLTSVPSFSQSSGRATAVLRAGDSGPAWNLFGVRTPDGGTISGRYEALGAGTTSVGSFHSYTIDWTRTSFVWSVDGTQVLRLTPSTAGQPFRLELSPGGGSRYRDELVADSVAVTIKMTVAPAPAWKTFTTYQVGDRVSYKGANYRVLQQHTALPGWQPGLVPALFQKL
ncbi:carbohydrate-binding protein [Actinoplanes sp. NPDC020271]|uniref:carbohydrate-binding protein n=1 Tax=Actinoplanes sp. NPDC020271 TaxID=3363896 RepID=UPI00379BE43C